MFDPFWDEDKHVDDPEPNPQDCSASALEESGQVAEDVSKLEIANDDSNPNQFSRSNTMPGPLPIKARKLKTD